MVDKVYQSLVSMSDQGNVGSASEELQKEITDYHSEIYHLTIKNYSQFNGLSSYVHSDLGSLEQRYLLKGRMGLSLGIHKTGTHIAFAAGTGILPFVDLIAHLILTLASPQLLEDSPNRVDPDSFKLILYPSFQDENEAVALDLIDTLEQLCSSNNKPIFEHHSRLSYPLGHRPQSSTARWTQSFFQEKIHDSINNKGAVKVLMCAPPLVQELFDRGLGEIAMTREDKMKV